MTDFEERLLEELKVLAARGEVPAVAEQPVRTAMPRGRKVVYGLAASAVLAAGLGVGLPIAIGGNSAEARPFEVKKQPDGGVLFKINEFRNPKGLEQRLRDLGVRAVVDYVPWGKKCAEPRFTEHELPDDDLGAIYHWLKFPEGKLTDEELETVQESWTEIRPELMPANTTLVVTATLYKVDAKDLPDPGYHQAGPRIHNTDQSGSTGSYALADGPIGPCVLVDDERLKGVPGRDDGPAAGAPGAATPAPTASTS
ncbi:hypothetical protein [Embleya sp. NBC_00896]|uniref:hypothetical protein n=1 Tax=Embleya sp. NBC_00896 TaxID=2975961 RepID=UPI00386978D3|nr:hypothetical protein OG928_03620 [Embleya sp. NBC_00896]